MLESSGWNEAYTIEELHIHTNSCTQRGMATDVRPLLGSVNFHQAVDTPYT